MRATAFPDLVDLRDTHATASAVAATNARLGRSEAIDDDVRAFVTALVRSVQATDPDRLGAGGRRRAARARRGPPRGPAAAHARRPRRHPLVRVAARRPGRPHPAGAPERPAGPPPADARRRGDAQLGCRLTFTATGSA